MRAVPRSVPWCLYLPALVLALTTCANEQRDIAIGVGYRSTAADVVRLIEQRLESTGTRIRILTTLSPEIRGPTGYLAGEVDYATRMSEIPGVLGVVGHQGSREALLVAPVYNEAGIAQVVPTATSRRLHSAGASTFMLAPDDSIEGEFIGRFAVRLRARSATLFYVLDEYGSGLRDGVIAELNTQGIEVLDAVPVSDNGWCPPDSANNDYASVIDAALQRGRPDVVILATRQGEAGCIIGRINRAIPGMRFLAGDGITVNRALLARAGAGADSLYLTAFWHPERPDSLSLDFARRFRDLIGREATPGEAMIYDALQALIAGIAEDPSREGVRRFLERLGHNRPPLAGVTGPIAFPGSAGRLVMTQLRGGQPRLVAP